MGEVLHPSYELVDFSFVLAGPCQTSNLLAVILNAVILRKCELIRINVWASDWKGSCIF